MSPFNAPAIIVTEGWILDVCNNGAECFRFTFCKGSDGDQTSATHQGVKYGTPKIHPRLLQVHTSATEKVSAHVGFYTKNGLFHALIPPPTTELKIR